MLRLFQGIKRQHQHIGRIAHEVPTHLSALVDVKTCSNSLSRSFFTSRASVILSVAIRIVAAVGSGVDMADCILYGMAGNSSRTRTSHA
jgi:hypothetical protein